MLALGLLLPTSTTQAQVPGPYALRVEAPTACGDERSVRVRIDRLIAGAGSEPMPLIDVLLRVSETSGIFSGALRIEEAGAAVERTLTDASCAVVMDAAALVVAFALVPGLSAGDPEEAAAPASEASPAPESAPPAGSSVELTGAVRLSAVGMIGVLPGVVVGGEIAGALRFASFHVELGALGTPFAGARFAAPTPLGGDLGIVLGFMRGCGVAAPASVVELGGCLGLQGGAAFGHGVGISAPTDAVAPWLAVTGALRVAWLPWPFLVLLLEAEALVPLVRPVFTVAGLGVLHRPEPVAGAIRIGLELRFR